MLHGFHICCCCTTSNGPMDEKGRGVGLVWDIWIQTAFFCTPSAPGPTRAISVPSWPHELLCHSVSFPFMHVTIQSDMKAWFLDCVVPPGGLFGTESGWEEAERWWLEQQHGVGWTHSLTWLDAQMCFKTPKWFIRVKCKDISISHRNGSVGRSVWSLSHRIYERSTPLLEGTYLLSYSPPLLGSHCFCVCVRKLAHTRLEQYGQRQKKNGDTFKNTPHFAFIFADINYYKWKRFRSDVFRLLEPEPPLRESKKKHSHVST